MKKINEIFLLDDFRSETRGLLFPHLPEAVVKEMIKVLIFHSWQ